MLYAKIKEGRNESFLKVRKIIAHEKTDYQEVFIGDVDGLGKALIMDNEIQTCQIDVEPYHEALVSGYKPSKDEKVLVIGSGEGVSVDLLLRRGWTSIDAVDIDGKAIKHIDAHLSDWNNHIYQRLEEFNLIIDDGLKVLKNTADGYYKYIIFDLTSEAITENQAEWVSEIHRCLSDDEGTLGWQDGSKYTPSYLDKTVRYFFKNDPIYKSMLEWRFGFCMK